ncbi:MAG: FAD-dependent oxidoreductase, partial [Chloroflexi bacterium]|nr:FAD-dependent oxidoreductase [Chloroflexota bacterium]
APDERCVWQVGSLEIAHTSERWHELKRKQGNALAWGLGADLVSPDEVKRMVPLMRTDDLLGAFYVPSDMDVKASKLCKLMAREATAHGVTFMAHTRVTDIEIQHGRVQAVVTSQGRIACEMVVCAAGLWGPLVGRMAGIELPMTPCQHLYVQTNPLPELADETEDVRHPIVRYQDKDLYFRQHRDAYGVGSYRHDPLLVFPEELPRNDHPAIFPFTPEHFVESWRDTAERFPSFANAGVASSFNGLFSFTPDGNSLLGESAEVRGFWAGEAVWVTHGGGVGRALAEWMVNGTPSIDLHDADVNRFHRFAYSKVYIRVRAERQYIEVYDIIHPLQQTENPRNLRVSPFHVRLKELGASFFESAGWERPQWFESNARLLEEFNSFPEREGWTARYWSPIIGGEHGVTRERVAMFDLTAFTKIEVSGTRALDFLQRLASNQMDQPVGKVTYTSMLNEHGGIECDLTVTRIAPQKFWVITGGGVGMHDLAWLRKHIPADGSVQVNDITSQYCSVGLWGPRARDVLSRVTNADVSNAAFPYMSARALTIGYVPAFAIRISYAGELGWEIYAPTEYGLRLWDTLWEAGESFGITAVGGGAFDSLRLEKGYRLWGADIHGEYNPYEAGLGFAVRWNKGEFMGRSALERIKAQGVTRKLCALTFDDPSCVVMGKEPILDGERVLGHVTSANFGYSIGKSVAHGYLPTSHASEGTRLDVYFFGELFSATVVREPLFDPLMKRIKA